MGIQPARGPRRHRADRQRGGGVVYLRGLPVQLPSAGDCGLEVAPSDLVFVACDDVVTAVGPEGGAIRWRRPRRDMLFWSGLGDEGMLLTMGGEGKGPVTLDAITSDGTEVPGWPKPIDGDWLTEVASDPDGSLRVRLTSPLEGQCSGPSEKDSYLALAADGSAVPGWPIRLGRWASTPVVAPDGTMYVTADGGRADAFSRTGALPPGWPVRGLDVRAGCSYPEPPVLLGEDGILVICEDRVTAVRPDGRVAPGWPVALGGGLDAVVPPPLAPVVSPAVGAHLVFFVTCEPADEDSSACAGRRLVVLARNGSVVASTAFGTEVVDPSVESVHMAPTGRVRGLIHGFDASDPDGSASRGYLLPVGDDEPVGSRP
jgi:hypothetical protein